MAKKTRKPRTTKTAVAVEIAAGLTEDERKEASEWLEMVAYRVRNGEISDTDKTTAALKYY